MLVGSWPLEMLDAPQPEAVAAYAERLAGAVRKALREAKRRSNWDAPNTEYEEATLGFLAEGLRGDAFFASFLPFVGRVARFGVDNSLVQTVLKLTAPGVPDTYQGSELWDFSLVDPDNRRPVDYAARAAALGKMASALASPEQRGALFGELMESWRDGRVKLATIALLLGLRGERPKLFAEGGYRPIEIEGDDSGFALGFQRGAGEESLAVVVALRPALREAKPDWQAFARLPEGRWRDFVRGVEIDARPPIREWIGDLPFAQLVPA